MIIPTLVLMTAMQFGDPQSGARIDDLSHSPWHDMPAVTLATYTPQTPETQAPRTVDMPTFQTFEEAPPTFSLGVADPDQSDGGVPTTEIPGNGPPLTATNPNMAFTSTYRQESPTGLSTGPSTGGSAYGNNNRSYGSSPYTSSASRSDAAYGDSTRINDGKVFISRAKVEFDKVARLSAPVGGIVLELKTVKCDAQGNVQRASNGDPIKIDLNRGVLLFTGQQIAQLDDRYSRAQYEVAATKLRVAEKEAEKDIEVRYAESGYHVASRDLQRKTDVNSRTPGAVPEADIDMARLSETQASLQYEKAVNDHETKQDSVLVQREEVRVAETQLDLRRIKTPFNAVVVNVITQVGNYLKEGDPLAEVAQLDKLKVIANVDGNQITQEKVDGKRVTVTVVYDGQKEEFEGFVRYAAPSFNTLRQFEVEIEVDNRLVNNSWLLKQGDFVDIVIHLN